MKKIAICFGLVSFLLFQFSLPNFSFAQEATDSAGTAVGLSSDGSSANESVGGAKEGGTKESSGGSSAGRSKKSKSPAVERVFFDSFDGPGSVVNNPDNTDENEVPASRTIHLQVETNDRTMFNQDLTVEACPTVPGSEEETVSIYCAILQTGLESEWSQYGDYLFLDSLDGVANNSTTYWYWFSNLEYGQIALNSHILEEGEEILLTFGILPLKLSVSDLNPSVNETITASLSEFGFDQNWNPIWVLSTNSIFNINGESFPDEDGTREVAINSDSEFSIAGQKSGFVPTNSMTIHPVAVPAPARQTSHGSRRNVVANVPINIPVVPMESVSSKIPVPSVKVAEVRGQIEASNLSPEESENLVLNGNQFAFQNSRFASVFSAWPVNVRLPFLTFFGIAVAGLAVYFARRFVFLRFRHQSHSN